MPPQEITNTDIIAGVTQGTLAAMSDAVGKGLSGLSRSAKLKLKSTYSHYIEALTSHYSTARSLFAPKPLPLRQVFVPLDLSGSADLAEVTIESLVAESRHSVIASTAGSGKSVLLKHLLHTSIRKGLPVPVFVELRTLNQGDSSGLRGAILKSLNQFGLDVDSQFLQAALDAGHFCLLLDGFDELDAGSRPAVLREIRDLSVAHSKNWIVITSRPDSELDSLEGFARFAIEPLTLTRAEALVENLPVDSGVRTAFVADLRDKLYRSHRSFASNPLLLSIMLLTYMDCAHIPLKLSAFYAQAYEALFQRHDASKGGAYRRKHRTALDLGDFSTAFSAFCALTYDRRELSFATLDLLALFDQSKKLSGMQFESQAMLDDCVRAVCLMVEDGTEITFAHRSLQEYFTARFITQREDDERERLLQRYAHNAERDEVISLLWEMDQRSVEKYFVLPMLADLRDRIGLKRNITAPVYLRYVRSVIVRIDVDDDSVSMAGAPGGLIPFIDFVKSRYSAQLGHPKQLDGWSKKLAAAIHEKQGTSAARDASARMDMGKVTPADENLLQILQQGPYWIASATLKGLLELEEHIVTQIESSRESLIDLISSPDGPSFS